MLFGLQDIETALHDLTEMTTTLSGTIQQETLRIKDLCHRRFHDLETYDDIANWARHNQQANQDLFPLVGLGPTCRTCQGVGHLQIDCAQYICYTCNVAAPGHRRQMCPARHYRNRPNSSRPVRPPTYDEVEQGMANPGPNPISPVRSNNTGSSGRTHASMPPLIPSSSTPGNEERPPTPFVPPRPTSTPSNSDSIRHQTGRPNWVNYTDRVLERLRRNDDRSQEDENAIQAALRRYINWPGAAEHAFPDLEDYGVLPQNEND